MKRIVVGVDGPDEVRAARDGALDETVEAVLANHPADWRTLHEFAYVDRPFRDVRRFLAARPQWVLADSLEARVGGRHLDREIRMPMGDLQIGLHSARLPIHWEDPQHPGLFPLLDATLEFAPVSSGRRPTTQIGFFGRYRPPFGQLGALGDTLVGSRVVLESVVAFLDDLTRRFEQALPLQGS